MRLEERLAVKLLAQAQAALGKAVGETLCTQPDPRVIRALVTDARALITEFEEQYFDLADAERAEAAARPPGASE